MEEMRKYVGSRYVPIFGRKDEDSIAWDNTKPYEPLTIVTYENDSYTSRQYVPIGVAITNQDYWALTGNYNGHIYNIEQALPITDYDSSNTVTDAINDVAELLPSTEFDSVNTVKDYIDVNDFSRAIDFDNVAAMKASTDLENGMIAHTLGFHIKGDGGEAWYSISNSGTANEMNVIACGDLYATIIYVKPYVTLEMFGGSNDNTTENDDAFEAAVRTGKTIKLISGGTYKFSGDMIDLADVGYRLLIEGNDAKVSGLYFRYNITSNNAAVVSSGIQRFNVCFKDIYFINNETPIMISCSQVEVQRCNFSHCTYCFGFPEVYIDYFHASDCYFYETDNFISGFQYDGTAITKGMFGDWIVFERCSFTRTTNVYSSVLGHSSSVYVRNCLHGVFRLLQSTAIERSYFVFEGHHAENRDTDPVFIDIPLTSQGGMPTQPSYRAVTIKDSFMYSTAIPDRLEGFKIYRSTINYGNNGNYKNFVCNRGSYERANIYGKIWFDENEFYNDAFKATEPTGNGWCQVENASNTSNLQVYDAVKTVKYTFTTSLEPDRLYFNGETRNLTWSSDFTTTVGKCPVFESSSAVNRSMIKNVYMHIFKVMDGVTYRCVIPVTALIRPQDREGGTYQDGVYIADEQDGVWGCPWEVYTGTIEYELT